MQFADIVVHVHSKVPYKFRLNNKCSDDVILKKIYILRKKTHKLTYILRNLLGSAVAKYFKNIRVSLTSYNVRMLKIPLPPVQFFK